MVKVEYCVCPMCGRNRVVKTEKKGRIKWDLVEPLTAKILQVREQHPRVKGGKCEGFTTVESDCLMLEEMKDNPEYQDIIDGIKNQTLKLVETLLKLKIIDQSEVVPTGN